jgi:hypothetical protein
LSRWVSVRCAIALVAALATSVVCGKDIVVHAGVLIDGVADTPRSKVSVVVRDGRMVAIQEGFIALAGAEVIDLSGETVLPGFIDCHIHVSAVLPSPVKIGRPGADLRQQRFGSGWVLPANLLSKALLHGSRSCSGRSC